MTEISEALMTTRETSGLTLEEVSKDLDISLLILEQIEQGNIGAFKDIFLLKEYIHTYAKYLGLDPEEVINEFNDYMFDITSKIPMNEIEKAAREKEAEEAKDNRIASPYTKAVVTKKDKQKYLITGIIIIAVILIIAWSISIITR